jgi:hypothetical protein
MATSTVTQFTRRPDANWDMTFGNGRNNFATGAESVRIRCQQRLWLLLGEWFLNTDAGVPYFQEIFVMPDNLAEAQAILKAQILGTEGVDSLTSFTMNYDYTTRILSVNADVLTIYDTETVNISQVVQ